MSIPLVIFKGQSNSAGTVTLPASQVPVPGVAMLRMDGTWGELVEPSCVWGGNKYGPGAAFMRKLMALKGWTQAGFINFGVGGSLASSFIPGAENFENAWDKLAVALNSGYYLAGVAAVDGESETNSQALADQYEASVWAFYYGLSWRVNNPDLSMVITKLGEKPPSGRPLWNGVRDHQQYLFDQTGKPGNIKIASAWGLPRETVTYLHYLDVATYDLLGERLANQMAGMV